MIGTSDGSRVTHEQERTSSPLRDVSLVGASPVRVWCERQQVIAAVGSGHTGRWITIPDS
jgi:hypothetical protein